MSRGFGIIGCGHIARTHAAAIRNLEGADLVGCYDVDPLCTQRLASEFQCTAYQDLNALLAERHIDVVTIATPSGCHLESAVAAAQAGKHLIVEKPLEVSLRRCDLLINVCHRQSVKLAAVSQLRFLDSSLRLKSALTKQRFGPISVAGAYIYNRRDQQYFENSLWRGTRELDGGGVLMNQGIHSVDLLLWLVGPITRVCAHTARIAQRSAEEDTVVAALTFANGALGSIEATTTAAFNDRARIEVRGLHGTVIIKESDTLLWHFNGDETDQTETAGDLKPGSEMPFEGHLRQFRDMIRAISQDSSPTVGGRQGRDAVEVVMAIYEAARKGSTVSLDQASLE